MPSWKNSLRQIIRQRPTPKVAVVGVGQELNGDDAAGVLVARRLRRLLDSPERWLVVEGGLAPENALGLLRRFCADVVILVDAAHMGETPGAVRLLDWQMCDGMSASTHTLPLSLVCRYLMEETGCVLALVGIQSGDTGFGLPPSPAVRAAVQHVARTLVELLRADMTHRGEDCLEK